MTDPWMRLNRAATPPPIDWVPVVADVSGMPATALLDAYTSLPEVRGLADYWAVRTGRAQVSDLPEMQSRLLLDMLGLGLEQTITYLGRESPDYPPGSSTGLAAAYWARCGSPASIGSPCGRRSPRDSSSAG